MHSWLTQVSYKPSISIKRFSFTLDRTSLLPSIADTIKAINLTSCMPLENAKFPFNSKINLSSLSALFVGIVQSRHIYLPVRSLSASHERLDLPDRIKAPFLDYSQPLIPKVSRALSIFCLHRDRTFNPLLSSSLATHTRRQVSRLEASYNPKNRSQGLVPTTIASSINPLPHRSSRARGQNYELERNLDQNIPSEPLIDRKRKNSRSPSPLLQRSASHQSYKRHSRSLSFTINNQSFRSPSIFPSINRPTPTPSYFPISQAILNRVFLATRTFSTTGYKPHFPGPKRSTNPDTISLDQTYDHYYDHNNSIYNSTYSTLHNMPPRYNNNKARYGKHSASKANKPSLEVLEGPLHTFDTVQALHQAQLKPAWLVEPKGPLSNYILSRTNSHKGLASGGNKFKNVKGICEGTPIIRCSVVADEELGIIGIGDHPVAKEAEKIACLSALLQLAQQGQVDTGFGKFNPKLSGMTLMGNQPQEATIMLSNRETITHSRARQFMDFYCNRFGFGKPIITYSDSAPAGQLGGAVNRKSRVPQTNWDAVMAVGGRKIGMGTGPSKKDALAKCYLDVTQYLESSDPPLWIEFKIKNPFEAGASNTAHVIFSMSDDLEEDIRDLSKNIQASSLYSKAMDASTAAAVEVSSPVEARAATGTPASLLETKSKRLMSQLEAYQANPRISKLRDQRASLPVSSKSDHILAKIESNWVTICMAATGSGKTTQIPQIILDDYIRRGDGASCNVVCTQPRRIAAISVAQRVAAERDQRLGETVGYQVRFDTKMPQPNGSITFCTTGIFLKRLQSALGNEDPSSKSWLDGVSHIIVDEVHERDLDVDLLMVVLKQILKDRRDRNLPLRIVLMSATINPALFQQYFAEPSGRPAPVAEVPGRSYPVEKHFLDTLVPILRNLPQNRGGWVFGDKDVLRFLNQELVPGGFGLTPPSDELKTPHALVALMISHIVQTTEEGHILVFLDGIDAINQVNKVLIDTYRYPLGVNFNTEQTPIHILHSSVPVAEQQRVFEPSGPGQRRIILATNIAETSITIPDVVYVVDTGRVKEKRYDSSKHLSSLVSAWVGQSNLNQRAGRAGRHREGEYYGILSQARLRVLSEYAMVEMKRSDLSNVIMHIKALNFPNMEVEEVLADAIEPPTATAVENAIVRLKQVGALTDSKQLTSLGRVLQELPVEVQIGKLVLYGAFYRCLDSALTLAAVISDRDPFLAPMDKMTEANEIKDSWSPPGFRSDLLAVVSAYNYWFQIHASGRFREASAFLQANFLNRTNFLNIQKVKEQIWFALVDTGVITICAGGLSLPRHGGRNLTAMPAVLNSNAESLPLLAALIATSSAPNFAIRVDQKQYRTSQDKKCHIHTSSVNQHRRENPHGESPAIIGEKAILAFVEKTSIGPVNQNAPSSLRTTTRLDPMTYMLFGAYHLKVTAQGLMCDDWLPIQGQSSLDSLDEVQRLKDLLETCMLRVFEGVGQGLVKGRSERSHRRDAPQIKTATLSNNNNNNSSNNNNNNNGNNRDENDDEDSDDEGEHEVETERDDRKTEDRSLSQTEIIELDNLTSDVVAILDRYAQERGAGVSRASTRPSTPSLMMPSMSARQQDGPTGAPPPASYAAYENAPYRPPSMRSSIPSGPRTGTIGGGGAGAGGRGPGGGPGGPGGMLPPTGPRGGAGPIKR